MKVAVEGAGASVPVESVEATAEPVKPEKAPIAPAESKAPVARLPAALGLLAPLLAGGVALLVHFVCADVHSSAIGWFRRLRAWQHPYPLLIGGVMALSLLAVLAQFLWPALRSWVRHYLPLWAGGLCLLCLFEVATAKLSLLPQAYFPGPDDILGALIEDSVYDAYRAAQKGESWSAVWDALTNDFALIASTWYSLRLLLTGYLTGVTVGVTTGVLIGWFPRARYWGMPLLKFVGPIPATALIPLALMISTESFPCAVGLIGFAVWFPVTMLTSSGIANVRLSYLDVARTLGAGRGYLIFRVALPSALPNIFIGLFMGLGASFLTLAAAESTGVRAGLGWYLGAQRGVSDYPKVFAALVIMAVFFSTLMTILFKLRDYVLKWQKGVIRW